MSAIFLTHIYEDQSAFGFYFKNIGVNETGLGRIFNHHLPDKGFVIRIYQ